MKKPLTASIICLLLNFPAYASNTKPSNQADWWSPSRIYMGAYGGYGNVSGAYKNDGQVTQGRLVLGLHAAEYRAATFGAEVGVESGNDMRLQADAAYRQLQLEDRSSSRDGLRKINPELQIGLGVNITQNMMLTAFYQGIFSGNTAGVALNSAGDVTISKIPTQQAVFVGLEYSLGDKTR